MTKRERKEAHFSSYFPTDPEQIDVALGAMVEQMKRIRFDTFAVTGISGLSFGVLAARAMNKKLLIVRKEGENSHSGTDRFVGDIGARWVFLDDFVSSGATFRNVKGAIEGMACKYKWKFGGTTHYDESLNKYIEEDPLWTPTFVGAYEYKHSRFMRHSAFLEMVGNRF